MKHIYKDPYELIKRQDVKGCVVTSGGFDPMHVGHATIASAHSLPLVVIVNGDGFLQRKKGFAFMPHEERMEIIAGVRGVDHVVGWDDGSQTVTGAIGILHPLIFTKGGDRDSEQNVPEFVLCKEIGCHVYFGVGGGKIQSSSDLVKAVRGAQQ